MSRFALKAIEQVRGNELIYKLLIHSKCQFDEFCDTIEAESTYFSQIIQIFNIIERLSKGEAVPENKYKLLVGYSHGVKEFEIRTRDLRVYLFISSKGKLIVIGGKKKDQDKDINRFRNIKKSFLKEIEDDNKRKITK